MKINATDLSAKLLATENISVRRARSQTASFDIQSRVLTLPMWKDISPVVEGMLVGHEVGHALYTTSEYFEPMQENKHMHGYLNVLEDVRIEKLMKRKYPGIRKTMLQGYQELNEKDFFGVAKADFDKMLLIDRINLYFKAGYACGVKFNSQEKVFVDRAEKTETVQDVIALARDVYEFSKEELEQKIAEEEKQKLLDGESDDEQGDAGDLDEIDEDFVGIDSSEMQELGEVVDEDNEFSDDQKQKASSGKQESFEEKVERRVKEELESVTDRNFYKKLEESADQDTDYLTYHLDDQYPIDVLVPFKTVLNETRSMDITEAESGKENFNKFKLDTSRVVNYLIKEFEMRKSAALYKRAKVSKMGSLDMRKVWSYKLNEDLFKRVTTVPQGKNHGMLFLLDWSGSMDHNLTQTVEQVITLAMFCQRAQIPYQVLAFSSQYSLTDIYGTDDIVAQEKARANINAIRERANFIRDNPNILNNAISEFALLEFFSSKMSTVEFNTMAARLLNTHKFRMCKHNQYQTAGTPLNEALAYMVKHVPEFIRANGIEKMTLITLTDGEGSPLYSYRRSSLDDYRIDTVSGYKRINQKHFLQDPVTKKNYPLTRLGYMQTESILRLIKDRFGVNVLGFYVCENSRNRLNGAIQSNIPGYAGSIYEKIEEIRKSFREHGFYSIKNSGRDDLFLIPVSSLKINDEDVVVTQKHSAKQIARNFAKVMSSRKTSRVLLNSFIGYVA